MRSGNRRKKTVIIGLTGGIAMGKSTVTAQFAALGAKTCSADEIVHALLAAGGKAVEAVAGEFPQARAAAGGISREALSRAVFGKPERLRALERILHPLVRSEELAFATRQARLGAEFVVIDIPLLFESLSDQWLDMTVTVSAPAFLQRRRALARPGMNAEKLHAILARQWPDREKRRRADRVILTGLGKAVSFRQVKKIMHDFHEDKNARNCSGY